MRFPLASALLLVSALPPPARSQGYLLFQFPGGGDSSIAGAGDVDGDGTGDLLVSGLASTAIVSGATGTLLLLLPGGPAAAVAGDLTGDGIPELLVAGSPAIVFSAAGGGVIYTLSTGSSVAGPGDLDGDGVPDLAVGNPIASVGGLLYAGRVQVFSGATGLPLLTLDGWMTGGLFGHSVAGAGDVDLDGKADLIVGEPQSLPPFPPGTGRAAVFSGATGAQLFSFTGAAPGDLFGFSVAGAGDADADGIPDFAVGAPQYGSSFVTVISGASGLALYTVSGTSVELGRSVAGAADVNGDGYADLVAGDPGFAGATTQFGRAHVFAGPTGAPLFFDDGVAGLDRLGTAVASVGDVNGDGLPDVAAGAAPNTALPYARVLSYAGIPSGSVVYGSGCPGSTGIVPTITTAGGSPGSGGNPAFRVYVSRALGGAPAILVGGASSTNWGVFALPLNLGFLGMPACFLQSSIDLLLPAATLGSGPGNGTASIGLPVPSNPSFAGAHVYFQWYVVDPGPSAVPGAMTPGLDLQIL